MTADTSQPIFENPLTVRRIVNATPERVFVAWTDVRHLTKWWGPKDVVCIDAQIDLQIGGIYRIANQAPDGSVIWITGEYECIERPCRLVFSWHIEGREDARERVTVELNGLDDGRKTQITIIHEKILSETIRDSHEAGWHGCLEGLRRYLV